MPEVSGSLTSVVLKKMALLAHAMDLGMVPGSNRSRTMSPLTLLGAAFGKRTHLITSDWR